MVDIPALNAARQPRTVRAGSAFAVCRGASVVYGRILPEQPAQTIPYYRVLAFSTRWPEGRQSWVNALAITHWLSAAQLDAARTAGWPADPAALEALLAEAETPSGCDCTACPCGDPVERGRCGSCAGGNHLRSEPDTTPEEERAAS